ncbi:velvet factor-domain-containing protein, partial [Mycena capillaripes]
MTFLATDLPPSITMSAQITEIQTAQIGRKCGTVDRRPFDPPPVILLQLFLITYAGTSSEIAAEIQDYEGVDSSGFICEAELFAHDPVQNSSASTGSSLENRTQDLVGATFVQATTIEYEGKKSLVFPFPDLSSKAVGDFSLRYKFFNISSLPSELPGGSVQAECWGYPFRVYSTKDIPSLEPSTEITKSLSDAGINVNLRNKKRKRKTSSFEDETLFETVPQRVTKGSHSLKGSSNSPNPKKNEVQQQVHQG